MKNDNDLFINIETSNMGISPLLNEGELNLLVSYSVSSEEELIEAVIKAFYHTNTDVFEQPTELVDWVNPEILRAIENSSGRPTYLSTRIWNHQVVITAEEVRLYHSAELVSGRE